MRGLLPKGRPLLGPRALAGRTRWRRRRRRIGSTINGDGYEVRGRVGCHGRHGRIAGQREPESRPEIGGSELLNFDELGNGHREGHGKHEEAESRHLHQMYRVAPEDSLKAADFPSGGSEGFKAFGVRPPGKTPLNRSGFPAHSKAPFPPQGDVTRLTEGRRVAWKQPPLLPQRF